MSYGYIRERKREPEPSAKPQITSFADVTLVLLVIFLLSAAAAVEMVSVSLPGAENTMARDINLAVTISISKDKPKVKDAGAGESTAPPPVPETKPAGKDKDKKKDPWLFYFEDDTTGIESKNLWTALKAIQGGNQWPLALVRADESTPCEHVAILVQCLQGLGADEIAFSMKTEEEEEQ